MALRINLGDYLVGNEKVLAGSEQGRKVRQETQLDDKLKQEPGVIIEIPDHVRSITPSFLEEFVGNAIRQYGGEGFRNRVEFVNAQRYDVTEDLEETIDRVLTEENALAN